MRDDEDTPLVRWRGKSFGRTWTVGLQEENVECDLFRRREISGQPDQQTRRTRVPRGYIAGYRAFPPHMSRDW